MMETSLPHLLQNKRLWHWLETHIELGHGHCLPLGTKMEVQVTYILDKQNPLEQFPGLAVSPYALSNLRPVPPESRCSCNQGRRTGRRMRLSPAKPSLVLV